MPIEEEEDDENKDYLDDDDDDLDLSKLDKDRAERLRLLREKRQR